MTNPELIATIAAIFTMIAYIPQAIKTIRTRDTKAISFWMYFISMIGVILWLVYGLMVSSGAIIFKNISVILLSGIILWIKVRNILSGADERKSFKDLKKYLRNILQKKL